MVRYNRRRVFRRRRFGRRRLIRRIRKIPGTRPFSPRFFKLRRIENIVYTGTTYQSTIVTNDPSTAQDWTNVRNLFEYYKVCAIKLHWIPSINTRDLNTNPVTRAHFRPMYIVHDYNNSLGSTPSDDAIIQIQNMRVKAQFMPWRTYHRMVNTLDPTGTLPQMGRSFFATSEPHSTQSVVVHLPGDSEGNTPGNRIGTLIVTYYLSARGRS